MQAIDHVGCAVRTIGRQSVRTAHPIGCFFGAISALADYIAHI